MIILVIIIIMLIPQSFNCSCLIMANLARFGMFTHHLLYSGSQVLNRDEWNCLVFDVRQVRAPSLL